LQEIFGEGWTLQLTIDTFWGQNSKRVLHFEVCHANSSMLQDELNAKVDEPMIT